jgi:hypothetical protein
MVSKEEHLDSLKEINIEGQTLLLKYDEMINELSFNSDIDISDIEESWNDFCNKLDELNNSIREYMEYM